MKWAVLLAAGSREWEGVEALCTQGTPLARGVLRYQ